MIALNVIGTILSMVVFFGIIWWAFSKKRKEANEEAANLPFDLPDEGSTVSNSQATPKSKSGGQP
jgi:cytochrome c oxidase cbb3-type subunit 4